LECRFKDAKVCLSRRGVSVKNLCSKLCWERFNSPFMKDKVFFSVCLKLLNLCGEENQKYLVFRKFVNLRSNTMSKSHCGLKPLFGQSNFLNDISNMTFSPNLGLKLKAIIKLDLLLCIQSIDQEIFNHCIR